MSIEADYQEISESLISLQKRIVPEMVELIEMRYNILSEIKNEAPIGRRNLAMTLEMSERLIRNEVAFFEEQKLVRVERQGMMLTPSGEEMIPVLKQMLYQYNGIEQLEQYLTEKLCLKKVMISPGNLAVNEQVLRFMGQSASNYILSVLKNGDVVALTGGASTAMAAEEMKDTRYPKVCVIPARGGIGKSHSVQANNVVAEMAVRLHSNYELLHIPDTIDVQLLNALKQYSEIASVFDKMNAINVFLFGIGRADRLADSRHLSLEEKANLLSMGAVGEAFGHYFDLNGNVISRSSSIGISINNYTSIPTVVGIAGGADKAKAIIGVCRVRPDTVLITDESAAKEIVRLLS